jgi:hypothetical protein
MPLAGCGIWVRQQFGQRHVRGRSCESHPAGANTQRAKYGEVSLSIYDCGSTVLKILARAGRNLSFSAGDSRFSWHFRSEHPISDRGVKSGVTLDVPALV